MNKLLVIYGLPQAFGLRNDEGGKSSKFFFFFVFVLVISGLWWLASLCKGGSCEATGGLREKLKIEN